MASRSKALIASVMLIAATGLSSYLVLRSHGAEGVPSRSGDLMRLVQRLVEEMPRPNSGAYDSPTAAQERLMSEAFRSIGEGRLDEAASEVRTLDYEVVRYSDTATGRNVVLLEERQRRDGC